MSSAVPDPDGYDIPALYADNQTDDTWDEKPRMRHLGACLPRALVALERLWTHGERGKCESPIEQLFLGKLLERWPDIRVIAQHRIGPYRADFLVEETLVVECDGRDFHSLPHHQVRDRDRDAYVRGLGYSVLRFTGSEIHRNDGSCIQQVALILGRD